MMCEVANKQLLFERGWEITFTKRDGEGGGGGGLLLR